MAIAGFNRPDSGRICFGDDVTVLPHKRVGMVFQGYALFPHVGFENVAFSLKLRKIR